jgi:hypothetical protein
MPALDNAHALVIGKADYQHLNKLPAVKDAEDIAVLLTDPAHCGPPVMRSRGGQLRDVSTTLGTRSAASVVAQVRLFQSFFSSKRQR